MKRFWVVSLLIAALALPSALFAQVETSKGKFSIGGKIKWAWMYRAEDDQAVGSGTNQRWGFEGKGLDQFSTTNVEVDIKGLVGEKVAYIIELQASWDPNSNFGGMSGWSNAGEIKGSAIGVRQAKIVVTDLIPMTTVTMGTFNLPLGTYQTRPTNQWGLINLPLMNQAWFGNPGGLGPGAAYVPIGLGWQATGVDICIKPQDMVALHLVYFNGNNNVNVNTDSDLEKSWLIKLDLKPTEGALFGIGYLSEGWQENIAGNPALSGTEQQNAVGWVINLAYKTKKIDLSADWMSMTAYNYARDKRFRQDDLNWVAWQATAGVWLTDTIEVLARYDWVDPDTKNAKRATAKGGPYTLIANNDAVSIITLGLNFKVSENAELAANYAWINEQGLSIDMDKASQVAGAGRGRRQQLDNDMFMLQVQVWQ